MHASWSPAAPRSDSASRIGSGGGSWGHSAFLGSSISAPFGVGSYAGSAMQPIFVGGGLRNNLRYAKSQERQTVITYQHTIQRASVIFQTLSSATTNTTQSASAPGANCQGSPR